MKLRTKLILSFSIVILLVGGIGITSSYINQEVKDQVTVESTQAIDEVELAGEMGLQLYQSLTRTQYLLEDQYRQSLSMNFSRSNKTRQALIADIDESLKMFRHSLKETRKLVKNKPDHFFRDTTGSGEVLALLDRLDAKFEIYSSLLKQLQNLSAESYEDGKEFFTVTIEPYFRTNLMPLIEKVRKEIQASHEEKISILNSQLDRVGFILIIATFVALLAGISLTLFLYRSIANPIQKIARAAKNIGRGNLSERIGYESNDELGELSDTFDQMAESLSHTTVSRDYVDSIIEAMADLLIVTDEQYQITRVNSAGVVMLDSSEEELLGKEAAGMFDNLSRNIFGGKNGYSITSCNAELLTGQDDNIPVSVSKGVIRNKEGEVDGFVIVASDISSEKEAQKKISQSLKEKEVMLAEIHHRVKNNLAVISGLLQMQMWEAESEQAASALQQSQLRVRSIALVHEKLYQSSSLSYIEFDKYTKDLLDAISNTYLSSGSSIEIVTDLDHVVLNINQAIPCSLLINELVVNAFKHAFEDRKGGKIEVGMIQSDEKVTLRVRDNGKGIGNDENDSDSLGMSLIETLASQLDGTLNFQSEGGLEVELEFKAEEVMQAQT